MYVALDVQPILKATSVRHSTGKQTRQHPALSSGINTPSTPSTSLLKKSDVRLFSNGST